MDVTYYYRPEGLGFSIERVFEDIQGGLPPEVRQHVFRCPHKGQTRPQSFIGNCLAARKAVTDICHITGDCYYLGLSLPRDRLVMTIHDCGHVESLKVANKGIKSRLYKLLWYDLSLKRAKVITVISEFTRREVARVLGVNTDGFKVILDPVNPAFVPVPKPFNETLPRILQVGTKLNKNVEGLIDALEGLNVELRIIGPLSESIRKALERTRLRYSNATGLKHAEIVREFQMADIVAVTSFYEGFGLPILEAQATGRPVVTSNCCAMPEAAGDGALLVDPKDRNSIREAFSAVIQNPSLRDTLTHRGAANVRKFEARRIASQYLDVYREMMAFRTRQ